MSASKACQLANRNQSLEKRGNRDEQANGEPGGQGDKAQSAVYVGLGRFAEFCAEHINAAFAELHTQRATGGTHGLTSVGRRGEARVTPPEMAGLPYVQPSERARQAED